MPRFGRRSNDRVWEVALGTAHQELAAAGDAVGVLDVDVQSAAAPEAAGARFDAAVRAFMAAAERLEGATELRQLVAVGEALEQTRYEIACARALLAGVQPPARSAPCLFDPAHGPSAEELRWGSDDGLVPVCAYDAQRITAGEQPQVRLLAVGGRPVPYWGVPAGYGALIEGYYARFGGARRLAELLAGTPLGEALGAAR
ncbi:MAG TPA: hypothetical protein VFW09_15280 [Solirubrobacteraceae bacterium]|nr:hypothetical protein [Solirubrobacteraceae bacterium]